MGSIVDALKLLVEQGELDIEQPQQPAVTSIQLVDREPGPSTESEAATAATIIQQSTGCQAVLVETHQDQDNTNVAFVESSRVGHSEHSELGHSELDVAFDSRAEQLLSTDEADDDVVHSASEAAEGAGADVGSTTLPDADDAAMDQQDTANTAEVEVEMPASGNQPAAIIDESATEDECTLVVEGIAKELNESSVVAAVTTPEVDQADQDSTADIEVEMPASGTQPAVIIDESISEDDCTLVVEGITQELNESSAVAAVTTPEVDQADQDPSVNIEIEMPALGTQPAVIIDESISEDDHTLVVEGIAEELNEGPPDPAAPRDAVDPFDQDDAGRGEEDDPANDVSQQQDERSEESEPLDEHYQPVMQAWADLPMEDDDEHAVDDAEYDNAEYDEPATPTMVLDDETIGRIQVEDAAAPEIPAASQYSPLSNVTVAAPAAPHETALERTLRDKLADDQQRRPFQQLRDGIRHMLPQDVPASVLLVSVNLPKRVAEVVASLGMVLADDSTDPILLVDGSYPGRSLSEGFEAPDIGLVELLDQPSEWRELVRPTSTESLRILPAGGGVVTDGIKEVAKDCESFAGLVSAWKQHYGFVLVDGGSIDSPVTHHLTRYCDATYLLVELGHDQSDATKAAVEKLRTGGGRVLGCIVDDAASR